MARIRTPEQEARIAAHQADFEVVKPYIRLFKEAVFVDPSKEAEADAMFSQFTEEQKDMAVMIILQSSLTAFFRNRIIRK